ARELKSRVAAHLRNAAIRRNAAAREGRLRVELAEQLADLRRLHDATLRVARIREWEPALREILHGALSAAGTPKGTLSLAATSRDGLLRSVSAGFGREFEAQAEEVFA